jgi:hypothetical protein
MEAFTYKMFSTRPTPSLEVLELRGFLAVSQGEPIPLDVAVGLITEGVNLEAFEDYLETLQ